MPRTSISTGFGEPALCSATCFISKWTVCSFYCSKMNWVLWLEVGKKSNKTLVDRSSSPVPVRLDAKPVEAMECFISQSSSGEASSLPVPWEDGATQRGASCIDAGVATGAWSFTFLVSFSDLVKCSLSLFDQLELLSSQLSNPSNLSFSLKYSFILLLLNMSDLWLHFLGCMIKHLSFSKIFFVALIIPSVMLVFLWIDCVCHGLDWPC